ncbi:CPBP family intramembrane metalloprotease [Halobacteria archaeon HArc-gm2]|nr:CPBP family intramembrane metalloprotease [Halobacteria archaeon HArc-gm2]
MLESERPYVRIAVAMVSAIVLGAGGLLFGAVLMFLALLVLIAVVGMELTASMQLVVSLVFVQGVGCIGVAAAYVKLRPRIAPAIRDLFDISGTPPRFRIGLSVPGLRDVAVVVVGYGLAFGSMFVGAALASLVQVDTGTNQAAAIAMENPEIILLLVPASILLIGPGEEALFRGVVQGRMREVFGPVPGVLIPSAIFAGLHYFALTGGSLTGNLVVLVILLGPSLVFGASYEYTDNIVVPSLIHGFYNATLFTLLYVVIEFGDELPDQAAATLSFVV